MASASKRLCEEKIRICLTIQVRASLVTSDHSGRPNAAQNVRGMHNTEGRKTRKVAAYPISDRAHKSLIHIYFFKKKDCFTALRCTNVYINFQLKLFQIPVYMKLLN
jgi:hypothetical protein